MPTHAALSTAPVSYHPTTVLLALLLHVMWLLAVVWHPMRAIPPAVVRLVTEAVLHHSPQRPTAELFPPLRPTLLQQRLFLSVCSTMSTTARVHSPTAYVRVTPLGEMHHAAGMPHTGPLDVVTTLVGRHPLCLATHPTPGLPACCPPQQQPLPLLSILPLDVSVIQVLPRGWHVLVLAWHDGCEPLLQRPCVHLRVGQEQHELRQQPAGGPHWCPVHCVRPHRLHTHTHIVQVP
jgi:hypothetical protein